MMRSEARKLRLDPGKPHHLEGAGAPPPSRCDNYGSRTNPTVAAVATVPIKVDKLQPIESLHRHD